MKLVLIFLVAIALYGQESYIKSSVCKQCHPTIYSEFYKSSHRKSSIYTDEVHKGIWNMHPDKKKGDYSCKKCHTPTDNNNLPEENNAQLEEGISCVYCHKISSIEKNNIADSNILTNKKKHFYSADETRRDEKNNNFKEKDSFFGMFKKKTGSPFHNVDYSNEGFYSGSMCMGCHSHLKNDHDFTICSVDAPKENQRNCITCHMPKVKGTATTIKKTAKHTFHGFAGALNRPDLLSEFIGLDFKKSSSKFTISIRNEASHNLMLHPLRVVVLKVAIRSNGKLTKLKPRTFVRIIGDNNKPAMPWNATGIFKDNMIKANENREVLFNNTLKSGDEVEVKLGYFIVNPKMIDKLNIKSRDLKKFHLLKKAIFK